MKGNSKRPNFEPTESNVNRQPVHQTQNQSYQFPQRQMSSTELFIDGYYQILSDQQLESKTAQLLFTYVERRMLRKYRLERLDNGGSEATSRGIDRRGQMNNFRQVSRDWNYERSRQKRQNEQTPRFGDGNHLLRPYVEVKSETFSVFNPPVGRTLIEQIVKKQEQSENGQKGPSDLERDQNEQEHQNQQQRDPTLSEQEQASQNYQILTTWPRVRKSERQRLIRIRNNRNEQKNVQNQKEKSVNDKNKSMKKQRGKSPAFSGSVGKNGRLSNIAKKGK